MQFSRRRFLQSSLGSAALVSLGHSVPGFLANTARAAAGAAAGAAGLADRVLVVLQLSGGNDGLNTVVPFNDPAYAKNRIALRVASNQVIKVNEQLGLHPQMTGFGELLQQQRLAIVQGVGYPNPDRSHFRSMDIWHSAQPDKAQAVDGWLGRCLEGTPKQAGQDVPALHLGPNELPLALVSQQRPVPSVQSLETFRLRTSGGAVPLAALKTLAEAPRRQSDPLLAFVQRSTVNAYASSQQVQEALQSETSPVEYPGYGLARRLQSIAQLIDAGLKTRIYYLTLDGFDTHANQLDAHAGLLAELSQSLRAFMADLDHRGHGERVLVMTFSEFGRRVRENASQGTDHGAAAPLFLVGKPVRAGAIGAHPSLTDLDGEGDMKFHTDFRRVYATLLDDWLGCPSAPVLGQRFERVNVLV